MKWKLILDHKHSWSYFAFKYKGEKGRKALFYADNDKLEFIWTIIPVIVLAGLIIYGLFTWSDIMNFEEEDAVLQVPSNENSTQK